MKKTIYLLLIVAATLAGGCANKVAPTGGPKDVTPPELSQASPPQGTTGFSAKKITLTFNEYVQLKDAAKQVVVSPPVTPAPRFSTVKKSVVVEFDSLLAPNTTYNISFGNAIADNNEGNVLAGFRYTFSTGTFIDTLTVSGRVRDALTQKDKDGVVAMLYAASVADTLPLQSTPAYFTRTQPDGSFTITNVAPGSYLLYAIDEKNNNYRLDHADELTAFASEPVTAGDTTVHELRLFKPEPEKQRVKECALREEGKAVVVFNRRAEDVEPVVQWPAVTQTFVSWNTRSDTLTLFAVPAFSDSAGIILRTGPTVTDTLVCRRERGVLPKPAKNIPYTLKAPAPELHPVIVWGVPVKSADSTRMQVTAPGDSVLPAVFAFADDIRTRLQFTGVWGEGAWTITLLPGAVTDIYDRVNDTIRFSFTIPSDRSRGSISFVVTAAELSPMILQLVNDKDEVVRERFFSGTLTGIFEKLEPGTYRLRTIADSNNNRRFDTGNHRLRRQPEKVSYYPDKIMVRANWEVEVKYE